MNKLLIAAFCAASACTVQAQNVVTIDDYRFAESRLGGNVSHLVNIPSVYPSWMSDGRFWYRNATAGKVEFIVVNPAKGTSAPAFDHEKLAAAISKKTGVTYTAANLPFNTFSYSKNFKSISFMLRGKWYACDLQQYNCQESPAPSGTATSGAAPRFRPVEVMSPNGRYAAFIKDDNLWVRDVIGKQERALTTDGIKNFGYATDNAGWKHSDKPVLSWSNDSRKIATFKQDQRQVSDMYLVTTNVGKPSLETWKYPFAGDSVIAMIHRVIIDVEKGVVIPIQVAPDPHRATLSDDISITGSFDDVDWSDDDTELAFVSTSRNHKQEKLRIANAATGTVREVLEEKVATQYESGQDAINWRYLQKSKEFIWYSERDNWGHLYLYDAASGKLKNQITKGEWLVTRMVNIDESNRVIYFHACGLDARNPYFSHFCKVNFDGSGFTDLTPESGNHQVSFSPDWKYYIDTYSQPDVPPVTVIRDAKGKITATLSKADISRLTATGWKAPKVITVKAHDGRTDLYGLLFTPTRLDSTRKYPVINYIYPGPQGGGVGNWSFSVARGDHQALAELGFVVVIIEGTSNPLRSKSYHDMNYGNMAENTLPDQVTGIRQLAARYAYMDTSRVGIWGHSGGGFATAAAMFRFPDFFKVGISESGNHDNRNYEDDWGERYNGLTSEADYANQANAMYAANLKGKLMLAHGMMDDNVPPYNTLLVVDALTKANKDYDLVIFPHARHGFGSDGQYMTRRRWDYFVRHLLHAEPPKEFRFNAGVRPQS